MTARSFGEITSGLEPEKFRRTFQPVRRNSYHATDRRALAIWKPIGNGTKKGGRRFWGALMRVAEQYDDEGKQAGKVNGRLGHVALRILREMGRRVDYRTGRLDPALNTIMEWTRRSKGAVVAALARLREHGFLDWVRRTEPIEDPEPFGPQVRQLSNAYGVDVHRLPRDVRDTLVRLLDRGPAPDDASWSRSNDAAETEAMYATVPAAEQGSARHPDDPVSAAALNGLGAALERQWARDRVNASLEDGQNPGTEV